MYITEELLLFKIIGQFSKQLNLVLLLPQNCALIYMLICSFCLPEIPSNINSRMMRPTHTFVSIHGKQSKPNISNVFFSFLRWIITPYFNILDLYQIHWLDLDSGHFGEKFAFFMTCTVRRCSPNAQVCIVLTEFARVHENPVSFQLCKLRGSKS